MEKNLITKFILEYLRQLQTATNKPSAEDTLNNVLDFIYSMENTLTDHVKEAVRSILNRVS